MKDKAYLTNPIHWIPERVQFQLEILAQEASRAIQIQVSKQRDVYAVRAGTAFGKTYAIHHDLLFQEAHQNCIKQDPDRLKHLLKRIQTRFRLFELVNTQVHLEGVVLLRRQKEATPSQAGLLLEGRFSTVEEVEQDIVAIAREHKMKAVMLDIHQTEFEVILHRLLARSPFGKDPCPPLLDVLKSYKESILYRREIHQLVRSDRTIRYYRLYVDHRSQRHLVAEAVDNVFQIKIKELFQASLKILPDEELERCMRQLITPDSIRRAIDRHDIPQECEPMLTRWQGWPLSLAITTHTQGLNPTEYRLKRELFYQTKYGEMKLEPFQPNWLQDYPLLIEHIQEETCFHIRGVDEKGKGLHFPSGTFSSTFDSKYNPEQGFQARIGYFIIPPEKAETFRAQSLSSEILQALEIQEGDKLVGYPLFVHPEAYPLYQSLHDAGIPFVKPEDSMFMGVPTSSYRSWLVRRPGRIPFIVKMSVAHSTSDPARLIPKSEVERCIELQNSLDQMDQDLLIFPESFGLVVKGIDAGMIIREIPKPLIEHKEKIISFSSVTSVEKRSPLIFKIMEGAIQKKLVSNPEEFIRKYLIDQFLNAIKKIHMQHGKAFSPHGQNLCWRLNEELIPLGFAYRDLEGISPDNQRGFLETFSWFWRYHIFVKLLNVMTKGAPEEIPPPPGAPTQVNWLKKTLERNLQDPRFDHLSVSLEQREALLKYMDEQYLSLLGRYFDVKAASILTKKGNIPAAEKGSSGEHKLVERNARLWKYRQVKS